MLLLGHLSRGCIIIFYINSMPIHYIPDASWTGWWRGSWPESASTWHQAEWDEVLATSSEEQTWQVELQSCFLVNCFFSGDKFQVFWIVNWFWFWWQISTDLDERVEASVVENVRVLARDLERDWRLSGEYWCQFNESGFLGNDLRPLGLQQVLETVAKQEDAFKSGWGPVCPKQVICQLFGTVWKEEQDSFTLFTINYDLALKILFQRLELQALQHAQFVFTKDWIKHCHSFGAERDLDLQEQVQLSSGNGTGDEGSQAQAHDLLQRVTTKFSSDQGFKILKDLIKLRIVLLELSERRKMLVTSSLPTWMETYFRKAETSTGSLFESKDNWSSLLTMVLPRFFPLALTTTKPSLSMTSLKAIAQSIWKISPGIDVSTLKMYLRSLTTNYDLSSDSDWCLRARMRRKYS